jgi:hypothetical protein
MSLYYRIAKPDDLRDLYRLRVQRLGGDGADTMSGDAELVAIEIRGAA